MPQCIQCGFLAQRDASRTLVEVDQLSRTKGGSPSGRDLGLQPLCLVMSSVLPEMLAKCGDGVKAIGEPHDCGKYCTWQQGFSPKEHREHEMFEESRRTQKADADAAAAKFQAWTEEIRERDRKWEETVQEKDRLWRAEQETKQTLANREWEAKQSKIDRSTTMNAALVGAIITAVSGFFLPWVSSGGFRAWLESFGCGR